MRADQECSNLAFKVLFSYGGFTVFSSKTCCACLLKRLHGIFWKEKCCEVILKPKFFATSVLSCKVSCKF